MVCIFIIGSVTQTDKHRSDEQTSGKSMLVNLCVITQWLMDNNVYIREVHNIFPLKQTYLLHLEQT